MLQDNELLPMFHEVTVEVVRLKSPLDLTLGSGQAAKSTAPLSCCSFQSLARRWPLPIHHSKQKGIKHLSKSAHFTQQEKDTFRHHAFPLVT